MTSSIQETVAWLQEEADHQSRSSFNNGCADCGVSSNKLTEVAALVQRLAGALDWKDKMIQAAVQELNEGDAGHAVRTKSWLAEALVGPPNHALSGDPT